MAIGVVGVHVCGLAKAITIMSYPMNELKDEAQSLADSAAGLMESTSDEACKQMAEAREYASNAIKRGKKAVVSFRKRAIRVSRAADGALHSKPYPGILIAAGVGLALGLAAGCLRKPETN